MILQFDDCKDAADACGSKIWQTLDKFCIHWCSGQEQPVSTTVEGDEDWGFDGLEAKCVTYKSGSLAVQDMLNGSIQYVIIDSAPAKCITEAINKVQG